MYTITLQDQEAQFLLSVLGELPTKTGAYTVLASLKLQMQNQPTQVPAKTKVRKPKTAPEPVAG